MIELMQEEINSATQEQKINFMFSRGEGMLRLCIEYIETSDNELRLKIIRLSDSERRLRDDFKENICMELVTKVSDMGREIASQ